MSYNREDGSIVVSHVVQ